MTREAARLARHGHLSDNNKHFLGTIQQYLLETLAKTWETFQSCYFHNNLVSLFESNYAKSSTFAARF